MPKLMIAKLDLWLGNDKPCTDGATHLGKEKPTREEWVIL
jgi:hypothetical protein